MGSSLSALLSPDGLVASLLPGFEPRPEQARMAAAVEGALAGSRTLVIEAGTGVGKSVAYLLPAALWAKRNGKRVVVSTHTKALQDQLLRKDMPLVVEILKREGYELKAAHLMGAENYLCVQRLSAALRRPPELLEAPETPQLLRRLKDWSVAAKTGRRAAIPFSVPPELWRAVHRDSEVCLGMKGPFWDRCLYRKDREAALLADVLIVNHSLLLSGATLPTFHALILDEAHNLADHVFDVEVGDGRLSRLLHDIYNPATGRGFVAGLEDAGDDARAVFRGLVGEAEHRGRGFFSALAEMHGRLRPHDPPGAQRLRPGVAPDPDFAQALEALVPALKALDGSCGPEEEKAELERLIRRVEDYLADLRQTAAPDADGRAHWVEWSQHHVTLRAARLDSSTLLEDLFKELRVPVIASSATLAVQGSLAHSKAALGLPEADELLLGSPFDYPRQCGLFLDGSIPSPKTRPVEYRDAVAKRCLELASCVEGGVFFLFSSVDMMDRVHRIVSDKITGRPFFKQGTMLSEELLAGFRKAGNGLLFGVDTFWQGVDVQGPALSCVVLTHLPFPNPHAPIEEARKEWMDKEGRAYFESYSIPKAIIKFRQGFGRLIRSKTDKGAVVILDPRVLTQPYGRRFLSSIPPCKKLASLQELREFLARLNPAVIPAPE